MKLSFLSQKASTLFVCRKKNKVKKAKGADSDLTRVASSPTIRSNPTAVSENGFDSTDISTNELPTADEFTTTIETEQGTHQPVQRGGGCGGGRARRRAAMRVGSAAASPRGLASDRAGEDAPSRDPFSGMIDYDAPVFFMIGSQRSGSNWLRTMLDEREDLAGPHPPHIMRDFMPIIDKFGDLSEEDNLAVLVDHVCTFVERNQVQWVDKHGAPIQFDRERIVDCVLSTCEVLKIWTDKEITEGHYLLNIFDEIMQMYTAANGKRTWICKSMGMSKYHDLLMDFYGRDRLRYIYLVRDPRDVAMSFMNT